MTDDTRHFRITLHTLDPNPEGAALEAMETARQAAERTGTHGYGWYAVLEEVETRFIGTSSNVEVPE